MKLPAADQAYIPPDKLTGYLLSLSHPVGSAKAGFFRGLGYNADNADRLAEALLHIARTQEARATIETEYSVKYVLAGDLTAPSGRVIGVQTIWIIETGQTAPRFVTAYPLAEEE
jgi:hypothetical protein